MRLGLRCVNAYSCYPLGGFMQAASPVRLAGNPAVQNALTPVTRLRSNARAPALRPFKEIARPPREETKATP